jgi:nicotinamidase-related amidase
MPTVEAEPYVFEFDPRTAVLVIIDMQRDFVDPGWYVKRLRVKGRAAHGASYSTRSLGKIRQKSTLRS